MSLNERIICPINYLAKRRIIDYTVYIRHVCCVERMHRTQVYLTDVERKALLSLSSKTGKSQSQLLRDAVDSYIENINLISRAEAFENAKGMWKNRNDLPNLKKLRKEFDRF